VRAAAPSRLTKRVRIGPFQVRGSSRTRALCPSALWRFPLRHVEFSLRYVFRLPRWQALAPDS
jgi:hypothetical protein